MCNVISNIHDQSFVSILWSRWTNDHPQHPQHNQIWLEVKDKSRKFFKLHGRPIAYKNLCSKYDKIHFFLPNVAILGFSKKNPLDNLQPFYYLSPSGEIFPPKKPCQWPSSKGPYTPPLAFLRLSYHPTHMMHTKVSTLNEPSMIYCLIF